jgi:chorismate mutase
MSSLVTARRDTARRSTVRISIPLAPSDPDTEQIETIRVESRLCEVERTRIRAHIASMRKRITQRDASLQRLFNQTQAKQKLEKVSPSMIHQLRLNVASLEHAHAIALDEVKQAERNDRLWASRELEQELLTFFQHKERLDSELLNLIEERRTAAESLAEARDYVARPLALHRMVTFIAEDSSVLIEKKASYDNGRSKTGYLNTMLAVQKDPVIRDEVLRTIERDLESIAEQTRAEVAAARETDENTSAAAPHLRRLIEEGQQRLAMAVQRERAQDQ